MLKGKFLGPALLVLLSAAGLSGCVSSSSKSETTQAPVPAQAAQSESTVASQSAPVSQPSQQAKQGKKNSKAASAAQPAQVERPTATSTPASQPAQAAWSGKIGPGMNAKGEVVDSSKVEAGYGQQVKGIRDWEGEITGRPAPNSKFTQLQIGMPMKQVTDLAGQPTDQGAYITGKAFIPFFFGSDTHRQELVYKNHGRLIFAGGSMGDFGSAHLVWIIHNANEPAYR